MKKGIIISAFILAICFSLAGCSPYEGNKNYEENTGIVAVSGVEDLYYDTQTKIVYFIFNEAIGNQGFGYMSAYYAPNGLPYLYDPFNQKLVEISTP